MTMIDRCRLCGHAQLSPVLDLGNVPLANALISDRTLSEFEPRYPLALVRCDGCSLVQTTETLPPDALFSDYVYFSSYSSTMVAHAETLVSKLVGSERLDASSLVVEIASNDGYLLRHYQKLGVPVLGVEPAKNVAVVAEANGIPTVCEFFGRDFAEELRKARGRGASVIHAHNVLAHVPDLVGFAAGIRTMLDDEGIAIIEVPYLRDLIDRREFDTIYHEHVFYFSVTALARLFTDVRLRILDVERVAIHGGSLRITLSREESRRKTAPSVALILDEETFWGVERQETYEDFQRKVEALAENLRSFVRQAKANGQRVAAYGASAKGCTLLNFAGLDASQIDFVADRSREKQGRYLPGVRIPIREPSALSGERPDYALVLAWNIKEEILRQEVAFREGGGRFIVPIPDIEVL